MLLNIVRSTTAAVLLATTVIPQSGSPLEEQIKHLERSRQDAFIRGDLARIEAETGDDYTTISRTGSIADKARMMASLASGHLKVRVYGDVAVLTGPLPE